jgi:hypothetical protein
MDAVSAGQAIRIRASAPEASVDHASFHVLKRAADGRCFGVNAQSRQYKASEWRLRVSLGIAGAPCNFPRAWVQERRNPRDLPHRENQVKEQR